MAVQINYNGSVIADLSAGQTATLNCKDKVMRSNVVVTAPESMGSAEFNIAYGDTAPTDTSKLWVKTSKPNKVIVSNVTDAQVTGGCSITKTGVTTVGDKSKVGICAVGEKIYLFGGGKALGSSNAVPSTEICCYDDLTETFTTLGVKLPSNNCTDVSACACNGKIYLFGGVGSKTIYCFDYNALTISTLSTLPASPPSTGFGVAALGTKVYLFYVSTTNVLTVYCFDCETEETSMISNTSFVAQYCGICYDGRRYVYFVGGKAGTAYVSTIRRMDLTDFTMSDISVSLSTGLSSPLCVFVDGNLCVFGGSASTTFKGIHVINIEGSTVDTMTDEEIRESLEFPYGCCFYGSSGVALNSKIYVFYGYKLNNMTSSNGITDVITFETAGSELLIPSGTLQISLHKSKNIFSLIDNETMKIDIGVDKVYKGNSDGVGEQVETAIYQNDSWTTI
jgi:hypothetical protein